MPDVTIEEVARGMRLFARASKPRSSPRLGFAGCHYFTHSLTYSGSEMVAALDDCDSRGCDHFSRAKPSPRSGNTVGRFPLSDNCAASLSRAAAPDVFCRFAPAQTQASTRTSLTNLNPYTVPHSKLPLGGGGPRLAPSVRMPARGIVYGLVRVRSVPVPVSARRPLAALPSRSDGSALFQQDCPDAGDPPCCPLSPPCPESFSSNNCALSRGNVSHLERLPHF